MRKTWPLYLLGDGGGALRGSRILANCSRSESLDFQGPRGNNGEKRVFFLDHFQPIAGNGSRGTVHRSRTANGPPIPNGERRETVHEPRTANRSRRTTDRQPLPVGFGLGIGRRGPPCLTNKNTNKKKAAQWRPKGSGSVTAGDQ